MTKAQKSSMAAVVEKGMRSWLLAVEMKSSVAFAQVRHRRKEHRCGFGISRSEN